jgi:hypothetical protein
MSDPQSTFEVGVVVAKRRLKSAWASHVWLPHAVLPAVPSAAPWSRLGSTVDEELYYAGPAEVSLHAGSTAYYRDNLASGRAALWVALRPLPGDAVEVGIVTADPYEGEALVEGLGETVEAVPMPAEIQAKVAAFFEAFHVERTFYKRKRDRADPEALGRHGPVPASRRREDET